MKILALAILIIAITVLCFSADEIARSIAERQLEKTFIDSQVTIKTCDFNLSRWLAFSDIEIKRDKMYDFRSKEMKISYGLSRILSGRIDSVSAVDSRLNFYPKGNKLPGLKDILALSRPGIFSVKEAVLSDLRLRFSSPDLDLSGTISLSYLPGEKKITNFDAKFDTVEAKGVTLSGMMISQASGSDRGELSIKKMSYNNAVINDARGTLRKENNIFYCDDLKGRILGGEISGDMTIDIGKGPELSLRLDGAGLDLDSFTRDFKMKDKFEMTGLLNGSISLSGNSSGISGINGRFTAGAPGGSLNIKDKRFIENMARRSGQAFEILEESLQNYRYNTGMVSVSIDGANIIMDVELSGDAGKREFNVILHDFIKEKGRGL
ncbi:MAG: YdbH domain-containing protein [Candidatus Omnitrophica bacterium]|nr:YdbH domain-containing protein [Candidatus Omnitrophota bacterium]